jgi:hypothetical protein
LVDHQVCLEGTRLSLASLVDQQVWKARMDLGHLLRDQNVEKIYSIIQVSIHTIQNKHIVTTVH